MAGLGQGSLVKGFMSGRDGARVNLARGWVFRGGSLWDGGNFPGGSQFGMESIFRGASQFGLTSRVFMGQRSVSISGGV